MHSSAAEDAPADAKSMETKYSTLVFELPSCSSLVWLVFDYHRHEKHLLLFK